MTLLESIGLIVCGLSLIGMHCTEPRKSWRDAQALTPSRPNRWR